MHEKTLLIESGKKLLHEGFTVETWGNISLRGADGLIYITPSGMNYETCSEEDVVVMRLDGTVVDGHRVPSVEHGLHRAVYAARPEVNAIVHTHPIYSTVFSSMGESIPLLIDEAAQALGSEVRTAPYALPGTDELAAHCVQALGQKANACLLQSHGAVCVGRDMKAAFKTARVLEMTAEIYYRIRAIGGKFIPISAENIAAMQDFIANRYGQR
ncbi:MAG: class II aldolase/adducin family protein [Butyricicoccus sp.]|nr:class II aldolase/adducin family protein [Butyricicoccus sp.]